MAMEKPTISLAQVSTHNTQQDLWIAVFGKVYDLTAFARNHPGGIDVLKECAGTDGTEVYEYAGHSESALRVLDRFQVGVLEGHVFETEASIMTASSPSNKEGTVTKMQQVVSKRVQFGGLAFLVALLLAARLFWGASGKSESASSSDRSTLQPGNAFLIGLVVMFSFSFAGLTVTYSKFRETLRQEKEVFEYPAVISVRR